MIIQDTLNNLNKQPIKAVSEEQNKKMLVKQQKAAENKLKQQEQAKENK